MKKRLVVQGRLSDTQLAELNDLFEVDVLPKTTALNDPANHRRCLLAKANGIIGSGLAITPELLDAAPNLTAIATISVGYRPTSPLMNSPSAALCCAIRP